MYYIGWEPEDSCEEQRREKMNFLKHAAMQKKKVATLYNIRINFMPLCFSYAGSHLGQNKTLKLLSEPFLQNFTGRE